MPGILSTPFTVQIARAGAQITLRSTVGGMLAVSVAAFALLAAYRHWLQPRIADARRPLRLRADVPERPDI